MQDCVPLRCHLVGYFRLFTINMTSVYLIDKFSLCPFCDFNPLYTSHQLKLTYQKKRESAKTIDKLHTLVTGQFLSMDHPCLKRFGENFEEMFPEFLEMPPFQTQTEAAQIRLGVFIVKESSPGTDWAQYLTMCSDILKQKQPIL